MQPGTYAGDPGIGAEDAWYCTAIEMEHAKLLGIPIVVAVADIWKCHDQILRPLLYCILALMGFPMRILVAYANFQEQVRYYNSLSGTLGTPVRQALWRPAGMPTQHALHGRPHDPMAQLSCRHGSHWQSPCR